MPILCFVANQSICVTGRQKIEQVHFFTKTKREGRTNWKEEKSHGKCFSDVTILELARDGCFRLNATKWHSDSLCFLWQARLQVDDIVKCRIQKITYFGIFVEVYKMFDFSIMQFNFTNMFIFTSFKPVEVPWWACFCAAVSVFS